jgi:hypothetical protein
MASAGSNPVGRAKATLSRSATASPRAYADGVSLMDAVVLPCDHDPLVGRRRTRIGSRPITLDRARIDRQMRDLALDHAAGRLEAGRPP